jgi:hypothetical protein
MLMNVLRKSLHEEVIPEIKLVRGGEHPDQGDLGSPTNRSMT